MGTRCWLALLVALCGCEDPRAMGLEFCGNGLDDDLDGLTDCEDPTCEQEPVCASARPSDLGPFAPLDPSSELARVLETDCSEQPNENRTGAQRPDCSLLPDDCGFGRRCVPLSVDGRYVRSRCLRQGCAVPLASCRLHERADACPRHTLCLDAPGLCAQGPCCVPLCSSAAPEGCADCRSLRALFDFTEGDRRLRETGICVDPPAADRSLGPRATSQALAGSTR